jgi:hypothetical protein
MLNETDIKDMMPDKYCGTCKQTKPITEFANNKVKKDGLQERCKECTKTHYQKTKHLRSKPSSEDKRRWLMSSYGLTVEAFNKMFSDQQGLCAICGTSEWGRPSPSIDHCHTSGKVRGLLCNNCNRGLGLFKDNFTFLMKAAHYVK